MDDSFSHTSSRERRVMRRRFSQNGGIALLHQTHEVGEVSGHRVSKAGRKKAVCRIWRSPDADHRKTAASSAHFGIYTAKKPLIEFRRARLAGLVRSNPARASQWRAKARPQAQNRPVKAAPPDR